MLALVEQVESVPQTAPAQSPQKVMSKTICWFLKKDSTGQLVGEPKEAVGVPQLDGSGEVEMSEGTLARGKK